MLSASLSPEEKIVILGGFDHILYTYEGDGYADAYAETGAYLLAGVFGHPRITRNTLTYITSSWLLGTS